MDSLLCDAVSGLVAGWYMDGMSVISGTGYSCNSLLVRNGDIGIDSSSNDGSDIGHEHGMGGIGTVISNLFGTHCHDCKNYYCLVSL